MVRSATFTSVLCGRERDALGAMRWEKREGRGGGGEGGRGAMRCDAMLRDSYRQDVHNVQGREA